MSRHAAFQPEPLTPRSQHAHNGDVSSRSMSSDEGNSAYSASASASNSHSATRWVDVSQRIYPRLEGRPKSHKVYAEVSGARPYSGMQPPPRMYTPGPGRSTLALPTNTASGSTSKSPRRVSGPSQRQNSHPQLQALPQAATSRVVRRVHAVVNSHVKEEDDSVDEELLRRLHQSESQSQTSEEIYEDAYDAVSASGSGSASRSANINRSANLNVIDGATGSNKMPRSRDGQSGYSVRIRKSGDARSANNDAQMYNTDIANSRSHHATANTSRGNGELYTIDDEEDELSLGVEVRL